jgi:di/tricarboxylate transporter
MWALWVLFSPRQREWRKGQKSPRPPFGIPIVYASILGGSCTLIGTASNLIVSTYRLSAFGKPFMMFDFSLYGLAMLFSGILVLFLCRVCGIQTIDTSKSGIDSPGTREAGQAQDPPPRNRKKSLIVLFTLVTAVVLTGTGLVHPSVAFGLLTLFWIFSGVLSYRNALENVNIPIIIFLGSMFGISGILEETGALKAAVNIISPLFVSLPPFLLILIFLYVTALFANILDNSVAALLMAPVAVALWRTGAVSFNPDALLLAVAAGASLGIVMPTHQATIVVMSGMDFPRKSFMKAGAAIAAVAGTSSAFVIYTLWC